MQEARNVTAPVGPKASTNPGTPIVTVEVSVSWIGANGYAVKVAAALQCAGNSAFLLRG